MNSNYNNKSPKSSLQINKVVIFKHKNYEN